MREINKIIVNKDLTIKETMRTIDRGAIKIALVVDETDKLCGTVTDGDIRRGILNGIDIQDKISKVMNKNFVYSHVGASREKLLDLIKNKHITGLPLVDQNKNVKDFVLLSESNEIYFFNKDPKIQKHIGRILVIGGAGYIGSVLVRRLLDKGYKVRVLDFFVYGNTSLKDLENNPDLEIVEGDTRHIEVVADAASDADAVVHLAELVGDPACSINPKITQNINYLATKLIASVCKYYQINRFIYTSSCSVYGASENNRLSSEESLLKPLSLYAKMKIEAEKALMEMMDGNFSPTILRLATVFGFSHRPRFDLVVNLLTAKALNEGKITIFGGDQWRPHVHVSDVAQAIICVLEAPIEKVSGQVFNVGSNDLNCTINQIGDMIHALLPESKIIKEGVDHDERDYKVDFTKIKSILNYNPNKDLKYGIKEIIDAFKNNKVKSNYSDDIYSNVKYLKNKLI